MRFSRDRRGQSVVVGTVILFGFLILALSLYQVQIVPQQNAEVEFQHFEEVRNNLVELRAAVLQAGSIDQPQYQTVQLGTTYPTRIFTINPPAPAGTIRTTDSYPITITNGSGTPEGTVTIPTRFIEYRPGYNELDRSPTWYDASVLYLDARDEGGGIVVIEDQELVNANGDVRIVALQNEFRRSGTGRTTIELYPAEGVNGTIPEGDLNVTVPTRLSGDEYWDGADIPINYSITGDANGDGIHNLTLETTDDDLTVDTVGVQEVPEDPTQNSAGKIGGGGGGGAASDVEMRVDDLTDRRSNSPEFYVSYDYGGQFDEIEVSATSTESSARVSRSLSGGRSGVLISPGFGAGEEFAVTVRAIRRGETVAQRTIYTFADTQNPMENDDLSLGTSAALDSSDISDKTNNNNVEYRFWYDVSGTGSFSQVQLHVVNRNGNGASKSSTLTQRSVNNAKISPGDGESTEYKLAILVVDADGVVVDNRIIDDVADGNDP